MSAYCNADTKPDNSWSISYVWAITYICLSEKVVILFVLDFNISLKIHIPTFVIYIRDMVSNYQKRAHKYYWSKYSSMFCQCSYEGSNYNAWFLLYKWNGVLSADNMSVSKVFTLGNVRFKFVLWRKAYKTCSILLNTLTALCFITQSNFR